MAERRCVVFRLDGQEYGVEIATVREIIMPPAVTRLPGAPPCIDGVINLRGQVLAVMDLRRRIGLAPAPVTPATRVMVLDLGQRLLGAVVEGVHEVVSIPDSQIEASDRALASAAAPYLRGVARLEGRLVLLLDTARIVDLTPAAV